MDLYLCKTSFDCIQKQLKLLKYEGGVIFDCNQFLLTRIKPTDDKREIKFLLLAVKKLFQKLDGIFEVLKRIPHDQGTRVDDKYVFRRQLFIEVFELHTVLEIAMGRLESYTELIHQNK